MSNILKTFLIIDELLKKNKIDPQLYREGITAKVNYSKLIKVYTTIRNSKDTLLNSILFDSFCTIIAKISECITLSEDNNFWLKDVKSIRNVLIHEKILTINSHDKIFIMHDNTKPSITYNYYYMCDDGNISYKKFILFHIYIIGELIQKKYKIDVKISNLKLTQKDSVITNNDLNQLSRDPKYNNNILEKYVEYRNFYLSKDDDKDIHDKIDDLKKSSKWLEKNTYYIQSSHFYRFIGDQYIKLCKYEEAISNFIKSKELLLVDKNITYGPYYLTDIYQKLSVCYYNLPDVDKCGYYIEKALSIYNKNLKKRFLNYEYEILLLNTHANYYHLKESDKEIQCYFDAYELNKKSIEDGIVVPENSTVILLNNIIDSCLDNNKAPINEIIEESINYVSSNNEYRLRVNLAISLLRTSVLTNNDELGNKIINKIKKNPKNSNFDKARIEIYVLFYKHKKTDNIKQVFCDFRTNFKERYQLSKKEEKTVLSLCPDFGNKE